MRMYDASWEASWLGKANVANPGGARPRVRRDVSILTGFFVSPENWLAFRFLNGSPHGLGHTVARRHALRFRGLGLHARLLSVVLVTRQS